jgi:hypothetical protein
MSDRVSMILLALLMTVIVAVVFVAFLKRSEECRAMGGEIIGRDSFCVSSDGRILRGRWTP